MMLTAPLCHRATTPRLRASCLASVGLLALFTATSATAQAVAGDTAPAASTSATFPTAHPADLAGVGDIIVTARKPGVTVRYYPFEPDTKPAPTSLIEKFVRAMSASVVDTPSTTRVEPLINNELFVQPLLPAGGKAVAKGYLVPKVSGTYRVGVRTIVGSFQFADKPEIAIRNGFNPAVLPVLQTVDLEAGKRYPFTVGIKVPALEFGELDWQRVSRQPDAELVKAAQDADVIIAVVGINSTLESEESSIKLPGFNGGDRTTLDLPADQVTLLAAAKATGKPLIVIDMSGSAINLDWAKQNADAIVQAWYPGEAGGLAVGRAVAGLTNPAGRLPITFYKDVSQLPAFDNFATQGRTYRYFTGQPIYPFGYGLSYTHFAYGPLTIRPHGRSAAKGIVVETNLTNTGARAGDEVAQLYLTFRNAPGVPRIALRGFKRVGLAAGETRRILFDLSPRDLSSVSPDGVIRILSGSYQAYVGGGQPGTVAAGQTASFAVRTEVKLPN